MNRHFEDDDVVALLEVGRIHHHERPVGLDDLQLFALKGEVPELVVRGVEDEDGVALGLHAAMLSLLRGTSHSAVMAR
jgi:signal transduction histidine kinase